MRGVREDRGDALRGLVDRISELSRAGQAPTADDVVRMGHVVVMAIDELVGRGAIIDRVEADLAAARRRNERLKRRIAALEGRLDAVQSSRTWRLVRAIVDPFGQRR